MRHEATGNNPRAHGQTEEEVQPPPDRIVRYEIHLRLSGLPAGGTEEVRATFEAALAASVPDGPVTVESVEESQTVRGGDWVEEHIIPLHVLFCTLPPEFQRADILATLSEHYHHELACLWRSVRDERCQQPVIELRLWRQAGALWICEFLSFDRGAPNGHEYNLHLQSVSQWRNPETGWIGHQGAIVLNTHDGQVSAHH